MCLSHIFYFDGSSKEISKLVAAAVNNSKKDLELQHNAPIIF